MISFIQRFKLIQVKLFCIHNWVLSWLSALPFTRHLSLSCAGWNPVGSKIELVFFSFYSRICWVSTHVLSDLFVVWLDLGGMFLFSILFLLCDKLIKTKLPLRHNSSSLALMTYLNIQSLFALVDFLSSLLICQWNKRYHSYCSLVLFVVMSSSSLW